MEYRRLGATGLEVSALGFGCIKFKGCTDGAVTAALHRALDLGITYFDTARNYGDSEAKIGRAIAGRRDDYVLSTKSASRDAQGLLSDVETSLGNLRTEAVDVLFLHTVSDAATCERVFAAGGAVEGARRAKEQGKVRHLAVSVHRDLATMRRCIDSGVFDGLMAACSALDPEGSSALLPVARARDMATVIMKPLSGGQLSTPPGPGGEPISPDPIVSGALRWVAWHPDVTAVIPGMVSAQQVEDNVAAVECGPLSDDERREFLNAVGGLQKAYRYGQACLRCGYCQPCPNHVDVPAILRAYDMAQSYPDALKSMGTELYEAQLYTAGHCTECRQCAEKCPAGIDVPARLREAAAFFGG